MHERLRQADQGQSHGQVAQKPFHEVRISVLKVLLYTRVHTVAFNHVIVGQRKLVGCDTK